jgi:hypothetical protein
MGEYVNLQESYWKLQGAADCQRSVHYAWPYCTIYIPTADGLE